MTNNPLVEKTLPDSLASPALGKPTRCPPMSMSLSQFRDNGFTEAAIDAFRKHAGPIVEEMHDRAIKSAEADAPKQHPVEITATHVRAAWLAYLDSIRQPPEQPPKHKTLTLLSQSLELLGAVVAGASVQHLDSHIGVVSFTAGMFFAGVLFAWRTARY